MTDAGVFLLIVWSSAMDFKDRILDDLEHGFNVLKSFTVTWDREAFLQNLKMFYSHSQGHLSPAEYDGLLADKMQHCGAGDFFAVVFEDPAPDYQLRATSSGLRRVNAHTFDKKQEYRTLTGGGHKVHTSDDPKETNKDLTLLFGLNTHDFLEACRNGQLSGSRLERNCTGCGGYDSIGQFFYVLNNSLDYCVLRNHECLPDEYTEEGHGDIDLLVENKNLAAYLTLAEPVFPEYYRVHYRVRIGGRSVPFDFRFTGDRYYDEPWERHILEHRRLEKGLFYVPDDEDAFYSLLYHAYVQKNTVPEDYLPKLHDSACVLGVGFDGKEGEAVSLLDSFMESRNYEYCRPSDWSVIYNEDFLNSSGYAFRFGRFVKRTEETGDNGFEYSTTVYSKKESFVKCGTSWLLGHERQFLDRVAGFPCFPEVMSFSDSGEEAVLEESRAKGMEASCFFWNPAHQRRGYVRSFVMQGEKILQQLRERGVCHRDIQPSNLIVDEDSGRCRVSLIDFGWACDLEEADTAPAPKDLNLFYGPESGFSDSYSFGKVVLELWPEITFAKKASGLLCSSKSAKDVRFTPLDVIRLFVRRHQRVQMLKDKVAGLLR